MRDLPKPPIEARVTTRPRIIFLVAQEKEIARIGITYEDLNMGDEEWERRKLLSRLFAVSPDMAFLLEDMSQDERIPADRIKQINELLDKIEG